MGWSDDLLKRDHWPCFLGNIYDDIQLGKKPFAIVDWTYVTNIPRPNWCRTIATYNLSDVGPPMRVFHQTVREDQVNRVIHENNPFLWSHPKMDNLYYTTSSHKKQVSNKINFTIYSTVTDFAKFLGLSTSNFFSLEI